MKIRLKRRITNHILSTAAWPEAFGTIGELSLRCLKIGLCERVSRRSVTQLYSRILDDTRILDELLLKEGGEFIRTRPHRIKPLLPSRSTASFERTALATSADNFALSSFGRFAGPHSPYQDTMSNPGRPDSATVGTLGKKLMRFGLVTASAFNLPPLTCG